MRGRASNLLNALLAGWLVLLALAAPAPAEIPDSIEAEASQNYFYIEPSYNGSSIVLFGSVDHDALKGKAFDIAVTIEGPVKPVMVWKKNRHAGLWINSESLTFKGVPNYYAVLSTRPVNEIAPFDVRKTRGIGFDALSLPLEKDGLNTPAAAPQEFQSALIRLKQSSGLFVEQSKGAVELLGTRLFRRVFFCPPRRERAYTGRSSIFWKTARSLARPAPKSV